LAGAGATEAALAVPEAVAPAADGVLPSVSL